MSTGLISSPRKGNSNMPTSGNGPRARYNRKQKGAAAEEAAVSYLKAQGLRIIERNWRCASGELDIVAEEAGVLVIVEVRSRSSSAFGTPLESVNVRKISQIRQTAEIYLHFKKRQNVDIRFDVVGVMLDSELNAADLQHIRYAF